jgi:hypothetical protein
MPRTQVGNSPQSSNLQQLLFVGRGLDLQITTDQALAKQFSGSSYVITKVLAIRKSGAVTVACAGGLYTAASKGGSALIAATQVWTALTGAGKIVDATLAALLGTDVQSASPIYLSLTTGSTGAATADMFVYGVVVD